MTFTIMMIVFRVMDIACGVVIAIRFRGASRVLGIVSAALFFLAGVLSSIPVIAVSVGPGFFRADHFFALATLLTAIILAPVKREVPAKVTAPGAVSKGFYVGSILGGLGGGLVFSFLSLATADMGEPEMVISLALFAFLPMIYSIVVLCMLVHKMWAAIQDGSPRTTPGKAVGFLFIPFFNFYWVFQAYWGWAQDCNAYMSERGIQEPKMPEGLALTLCILTLVSVVPFLGILASLVNLGLLAAFFAKACDGINAIARAKQEA